MNVFSYARRASAVAVAIGVVAAVATPAHAIQYATGEYAFTNRGGVCFEAYAGTAAGVGDCGIGFSIGTFSVVVFHSQDGTCSGAAPATLTITSPSTPNVPPVEGTLLVSHGVGTFSGAGTSGLVVAVADAKLTGAVCRPQNVLGAHQTFFGNYELHA